MRDKGWTAPSGQQHTAAEDFQRQKAKVLEQENAGPGLPATWYEIGLWMFGPALLEFGSEQQSKNTYPK